MSLRTDTFDLGGLRLTSGEGRRLELHVGIDPFELGAGDVVLYENDLPDHYA